MFIFVGLKMAKRFKNGENVPIHLLFSNLTWGLALDRREAR